MGIYIHIKSSEKNKFLKELIQHDCILANDIEDKGESILVLANIAEDFVKYNIDGRISGAIKVVFYAEYYDDNPNI